MQRTILHIDLDAFFASVEQVLDPALAGRAVIVGGLPDDRSVVASASYEARARGVKTGMPIAKAYRICPDGVFLRGTFANYERASRQVFEVCSQFSPVVEPASIDEGYIDMTGTERLWRNAGGIGHRDGNGDRVSGIGHFPMPSTQCSMPIPPIPDTQYPVTTSWSMRAACSLRARVLARTGLHVSIGIGSSKMLARIATDLAKPNGICLVPPGCEDGFLSPMPAGVIPGVGPKTAQWLVQAGIKTVADLRLASARGRPGHRRLGGTPRRRRRLTRLPSPRRAARTPLNQSRVQL
jgi:DNA polymerase-4